MDKLCKTCNNILSKRNNLFCSNNCYNIFRKSLEVIKFRVDKNGCYICTSHKGDKDGYPKITRRINGKCKSYPLSRFIYGNKYGKIKKGLFVLHSCDNPKCINLQHLRVGTAKDNSMDAVKRGRIVKGEQQHLSVLTDKKVRKIKSLFPIKSDKEISKQFKVSIGTIWFIRKGLTWKHI
jgi:hypothetical protein